MLNFHRVLSRSLLGLLGFLFFFMPSLAQTTVIHAGRLIDATNNKVRTQVTILIEGSKIVNVNDGYSVFKKFDNYYDLKKFTVLPGLIDGHTHIFQEFNSAAYSEGFRMDPADFAFRMLGYVNLTLSAGFTTIRDLGDRDRLSISLRNAINKGWLVGPRIYTAGKSIASTGGHADPSNGLNNFFMGDPGPLDGVINGADDARKAVRQRYKDGSDLIKITATGGVLSLAANGQNPQFTDEEIRAIVETAHDYGFKVAAHAHGKEGMARAIRCGVDSIEHGTYLDDEIIELMKKHGTYLVPTLLAGKYVSDQAEIPGAMPAVVRAKAIPIGAQIASSFSKAYKAGVKIAFGTDAGVYPHGRNGEEFALMVQAGMSPMEVILSSVRGTATLIGIQDELGTIQHGMLADIIAVDGQPDQDIQAITKVVFVMKEGKAFKQP